ncbi:DMT family transporter [Amphritea balenae]|uniref:Multidrug efflux SMR transporter n=1 Tax=Amphritea balenae TaxID=452629 RepID=A0A3P1STX0_9GAMM|nr:multidrug efflux SMR transporter [Amphritea balenae]RRD00375.1 multidrug efflux SMR transporter [Amphritea balenae]GGK85959.1 multidrug transporter [Amphritea balenae]
MGQIYLAIAILAEVIATSALKSSEEFSRIGPSILVIIGYAISFYFLSLALKSIPLGVAYAVWAGAGVALIAVVGAFVYKQPPDLPAIIGMCLIVTGVVVINLFSSSSGH